MANGIPKEVILSSRRDSKVFKSLTEASVYLECNRATLLYHIKTDKPIKGYYVDYLFTGRTE